jgi:Tfp pilus assembly protein PilO
MALNKRELVLLTATITLTVLGVNYLLLMPLSRRWTLLGNQLKLKRTELQMVEAYVRLTPQRQKDYDELRGKEVQQSGQFRQPSDASNKIEDLGGKAGILIKDRRDLSPTDKVTYLELPVQRNFDATTETLVKFLFAVQNNPEFMTIEELNVTPQGDNAQLLRCVIRLRTLISKAGSTRS